MNMFSIIDKLSAAADQPTAPAPRRTALRQLGTAGARALAAGLPLALTAPAARAGISATTYDALLLLLRLENLLVALYTRALASPVLAGPYAADLALLRQQQTDHATFLARALRDAGALVPAPPTFDFSGQRGQATNPVLFPDVFTSISAFLSLAQQLEDASVAIYKGQAAQFSIGDPLLTAVLRIHTVEARHAAHLRTLRRATGARVKPWPSPGDAALSPALTVPAPPPAVAPATATLADLEANTTQRLGIALVPFPSILTGTAVVQINAAAEAFDEPLSTGQAQALLAIFG